MKNNFQLSIEKNNLKCEKSSLQYMTDSKGCGLIAFLALNCGFEYFFLFKIIFFPDQ